MWRLRCLSRTPLGPLSKPTRSPSFVASRCKSLKHAMVRRTISVAYGDVPMSNESPPQESPAKKSRVLLVDDHPIVRLGLGELIDATPDLMVCAEASSASDAMELVQTRDPDVAIIDIALQDRSGVELIKDLLARKPGLLCLALSMHDE